MAKYIVSNGAKALAEKIYRRQYTADKDVVRLLSSILTKAIFNESALMGNFKMTDVRVVPCTSVLQPCFIHSLKKMNLFTLSNLVLDKNIQPPMISQLDRNNQKPTGRW